MAAPQPMEVEDVDVLIIGAGFAGIAAARELHSASWPVSFRILEATSRPGGRAGKTIQVASQPVELGANWIHGQKGNIIFELARERDLIDTDEENSEDRRLGSSKVLMEGGVEMDEREFQAALDFWHEVWEHQVCTYRSSDYPARRDASPPSNPGQEGGGVTSGSDHYSLYHDNCAEFLRAKCDAWQASRGYSEQAQRVFDWRGRLEHSISAGDLRDVGLRGIGHYEEYEGSQFTRLKHGYKSLVDSLVADLPPGAVLYNTRATRIAWAAEGTDTTDSEGSQGSTAAENSRRAGESDPGDDRREADVDDREGVSDHKLTGGSDKKATGGETIRSSGRGGAVVSDSTNAGGGDCTNASRACSSRHGSGGGGRSGFLLVEAVIDRGGTGADESSAGTSVSAESYFGSERGTHGDSNDEISGGGGGKSGRPEHGGGLPVDFGAGRSDDCDHSSDTCRNGSITRRGRAGMRADAVDGALAGSDSRTRKGGPTATQESSDGLQGDTDKDEGTQPRGHGARAVQSRGHGDGSPQPSCEGPRAVPSTDHGAQAPQPTGLGERADRWADTGADTPARARVLFRARTVLFTASLGVLKHDHARLFYPPLPDWKVAAIERAGFGVVEKVFLDWGDVGCPTELPDNVYFMHAPARKGGDEDEDKARDRPGLYDTLFSCFRYIPQQSGLSVCWCPGLDHSLPDETVRSEIMRALRTFTGRPSLREPARIIRTRWRADPAFRGSYSFIMPGATVGNIHELATPLQGCAAVDPGGPPSWARLPSASQSGDGKGDCREGNPRKEAGQPSQQQECAGDASSHGDGSDAMNTGDSEGVDGANVASGVLRFAGEATHHRFFSTVHGAFMSGAREASAILDAFAKKRA